MIIYINGYGAPKEPITDDGLTCYLSEAKRIIGGNTNVEVYLAGGYTNRSDLSEAEAMQEWLNADGISKAVKTKLITSTTTARDNLLIFRNKVGDVPVLICCEYSRQPSMKFFADKLFSNAIVYGIKFDKRSLRFSHRLFQNTVKLWLEQLAWRSELFDSVRKKIRAQHIARAKIQQQ